MSRKEKLSLKDLEDIAKKVGLPECPKFLGNGLYKIADNCITGQRGVELFLKIIEDETNNDKQQ